MYHSKKKATCKQVIYDGVWFKEEMLRRWRKEIVLNEVGFESILLERDEVNEDLIPLHEIQTLPNPLLAHSFIYVEDEGDEWICVVVTDESNRFNHYEAWLKNNEEIK